MASSARFNILSWGLKKQLRATQAITASARENKFSSPLYTWLLWVFDERSRSRCTHHTAIDALHKSVLMRHAKDDSAVHWELRTTDILICNPANPYCHHEACSNTSLTQVKFIRWLDWVKFSVAGLAQKALQLIFSKQTTITYTGAIKCFFLKIYLVGHFVFWHLEHLCLSIFSKILLTFELSFGLQV